MSAIEKFPYYALCIHKGWTTKANLCRKKDSLENHGRGPWPRKFDG